MLPLIFVRIQILKLIFQKFHCLVDTSCMTAVVCPFCIHLQLDQLPIQVIECSLVHTCPPQCVYMYTYMIMQMSYYVFCLLLVPCSSLSSPSNGMNNCTSGGNYPPGEFCTFTCINGYHLVGSSTKICQSDGSWSGSDITCIRE